MKLFKLLLITLLLSACVSNSPKQNVAAENTATSVAGKDLVIKTIVFSNPDEIRSAIKNECMLVEKLTSFIEDNVKGAYNIVESSADADVLEVQISAVHGNSGGAWSGSKMVQIKGELKRKDGTATVFKAKRFSSGGAFAQFKGTCSILGRCVKTLGKDVGQWLQEPVNNALLGDM